MKVRRPTRKKPSVNTLGAVRFALEVMEQQMLKWRSAVDPPKEEIGRWMVVLRSIKLALR